MNDAELNELYNRAACLAYPSSYEGFGIPVIEAMRAGCPVVCTPCKAVLEVGAHALVVADERDAQAMADAVLRTTLEPNRKTIIQAGFTVARSYSWERTYRQTLDVYRSLMA